MGCHRRVDRFGVDLAFQTWESSNRSLGPLLNLLHAAPLFLRGGCLLNLWFNGTGERFPLPGGWGGTIPAGYLAEHDLFVLYEPLDLDCFFLEQMF